MKILRKLLAVSVAAAAAVSLLEFPAAAKPMTAKEITADMGIGWNLGNSFDSKDCNWIADESQYETGWGNPVVTKALIDKVSELGFRTVRIPVSWHNHVDAENNISSAWMQRVKTVVDYAVDDGLYVIINIHHDNDIRYGQQNYFYPSREHYAVSENYVRKIWEQISDEFKDYGQEVIFETLNEPRLIGDSSEWWFDRDNPPANVSEAIGCINDLNQTAVDAIRNSGGNNGTRLIMCPGYDASPDGAVTAGFSLPDDSAGMTAVSIHAYSPYDFAMNAAGGTTTYSDDMKSQLEGLFGMIKTSLTDRGICSVIGEFGAFDKHNSAQRCSWMSDYISKAQQQGIPCVLWDNNAFLEDYSYDYDEKLGFLNRDTLAPVDQNYANALLYNEFDLSKTRVTVSSEKVYYDGSPKKPSVTVTAGRKLLVKGTDYTVSYSDNTNVGTATVTVTGKGKYRGTNSANFTIAEAQKMRGDVNRDGTCNMRDLVALRRYLVGFTDVEIDTAAADLYVDGKINMKDYATLQRLLNGWDV